MVSKTYKSIFFRKALFEDIKARTPSQPNFLDCLLNRLAFAEHAAKICIDHLFTTRCYHVLQSKDKGQCQCCYHTTQSVDTVLI